MYSLSPNPILLCVRYVWREITPGVLDAAHATALRALGDAPRRAAVAFETELVGVLFGGV